MADDDLTEDESIESNIGPEFKKEIESFVNKFGINGSFELRIQKKSNR